MEGGACVPKPCRAGGVRVPHSPTVCNGTTGDTCFLECDAGYVAAGVHTCQPDGAFRGGECRLYSLCADGEDDCDAHALCEHQGPGAHTCACVTYPHLQCSKRSARRAFSAC